MYHNATFEIFTQCIHYIFLLYFCDDQGALKHSTGVQCRKKLPLAEKVDAVSHVPPTPGSISLHGNVGKNTDS